MSPIIRLTMLGVLLLAGIVSFTACGTPNSQASFDADSQKHTEGWLPAGHAVAAGTNLEECKTCHGSDLAGGVSQVECTRCHIGGSTSKHPATWSGTAILSNHGRYVVANGSSSCKEASCHGSTLKGVTDSGPSCSSCHSYP
jgi:uncharacterized paraquat-inducible protein A